jgi:hypothetical protein
MSDQAAFPVALHSGTYAADAKRRSGFFPLIIGECCLQGRATEAMTFSEAKLEEQAMAAGHSQGSTSSCNRSSRRRPHF